MPKYIPLLGSAHAPMPKSRAAGPVDRSEVASLTIRVRSAGNTEELEKRAYQQSSRPVEERSYLSRDEIARTYGADPADLQKVEEYASKHNLVVVHRSAAERSLVVKGALGDLLNAFPAQVQMFHHSTGTYRSHLGEIAIPEELNGIITGVLGYDTRPKHRAPHRSKMLASNAGPGGDNGVASTDFARRYNFPQQSGGKTLDGSGQTIAIIELGGGYRVSDLSVYFEEIGVHEPAVSFVSVDHAGNSPSAPDSDDGEVMLDIEVAGAVAPAAKIVVYFAPNSGNKGFIDAISAAVHDTERNPQVISISWGGPEDFVDKQSLNAFHEIFVVAANAGITICVASGDHGTADLDAQHWDGKIHVDHPSSDPLVSACGGTQIDANGQDVVWNDGTPFDVNSADGGGWASSGGISQVFPVPPYQQNANLPVSIVTGKPGRGVPDIAMSATNYFVRVDSSEGASGGTSAVAPLMSALVVLLNQAIGKSAGFLNPTLYANAARAVHDVTQGTNAITNTVQGYNAVPGWDACTGLGTPDGAAILALLMPAQDHHSREAASEVAVSAS
jgi:kumamolisin